MASSHTSSPHLGGMSSPFAPPRPRHELGWPTKAHPTNLVLRLSAGLAGVYDAVRSSRAPAARRPPAREHATEPDGRLRLAPDVPLLGGQRYQYSHTLSESGLSQLICATDLYVHCGPTSADGRRRPLVVIKVMNAQHWALGAQEYERVRLLRPYDASPLSESVHHQHHEAGAAGGGGWAQLSHDPNLEIGLMR